jgi:hypothetical protein
MVMQCVNKLCGIEPINLGEEKIDFLSYLLTGQNIRFAFASMALLGIVVVVILAIFSILRNITKDKPNTTPAKIVVQSGKNILMFLFVPFIMLTVTYFLNTFMQAVYQATLAGSTSIGSFLFVSFGQEAGLDATETSDFLTGVLDYTKNNDVFSHLEISDYQFILSWIVGIVVLFAIVGTLAKFVERTLSILVLFIISPISIGSSVIDEGARFKAWRDQVISKFLVAYGLIIAINIYCLMVNLVMQPGFGFFEPGSILNYVAKVLLVLGGALALNSVGQLIGNLVAPGIGGQDLASADMTKGVGKAVGLGKAIAFGPAGYAARFGVGILSDAVSQERKHLGGKLLNKLGMGPGSDKKSDKESDSKFKGDDSKNKDKEDKMSNLLKGNGSNDDKKDENKDNHNDNKNDNNNNNKMKDIIASSGNNNNNNNDNKNNNNGG